MWDIVPSVGFPEKTIHPGIPFQQLHPWSLHRSEQRNTSLCLHLSMQQSLTTPSFPTVKGKIWDIIGVCEGRTLSPAMQTTSAHDRQSLPACPVKWMPLHTEGTRRWGWMKDELDSSWRAPAPPTPSSPDRVASLKFLRICLRFSPRPEHPGSGRQLVPPTNIECVEFERHHFFFTAPLSSSGSTLFLFF